MVRREAQRLDDIAQAIADLHAFTSGVTASAYGADAKIQSAVASKLIVIGEAIKHLPTELRNRHRTVDWAKWAGLRDVLVHQYFRIEQPRIWRIIERDVSLLEAAIAEELSRIALGG